MAVIDGMSGARVLQLGDMDPELKKVPHLTPYNMWKGEPGGFERRLLRPTTQTPRFSCGSSAS
jgi:hypothetical protein